MPLAADFRALLWAALAGAAVMAGQVMAYASALGGGSAAATVAWVVAGALGSLGVMAYGSGDGGTRRVGEAAALASILWAVLELGLPEHVQAGIGLDFAVGIGAGAALALAGRGPLRLAVRLAGVAAALALALVLDAWSSSGDLAYFLPPIAVVAVGIADTASTIAARGQLLAAGLLVAVPAGALAAGVLLDERQAEQARREAVEASQPPPARVGRDRIAWTFQAAELYSGPLVAGDVVVADARDGVHGLDAATGKPRWQARVPGRDGATAPALDRGLLLYPANLAGLYAIDVASGRELWRFARPETSLWSVASARDVVVAGALGPRGPRLFGLRRGDGRLLWTRDVAGDRLDLSPGAKGVRYDSGSGVWLVDLRTGRLAGAGPPPPADYTYGDFSALRSQKRGWLYRPGWDASTSEPVEAGGVVFVSVTLDPPKLNGGLYALDAASGRLRWRVELSGDAIHRPAVRGRLVYVASASGGLHAVRR